MKITAVLHMAFAGLVLAGILISDTTLRIGAFALGAICFVAGIVVARRDDGQDSAASS